jgi:hypothetical protein
MIDTRCEHCGPKLNSWGLNMGGAGRHQESIDL